MSVSSTNAYSSNSVVIQSQINRQKIDNQVNRDKDLNDNQKSSFNSKAESSPKVTGDEAKASFEEVYAQYSVKDNSKVSAYTDIQNQDQKESFSNTFGISVYA